MRLIGLTVQVMIESEEKDNQLKKRIEQQIYDIYDDCLGPTNMGFQLKINSIDNL